ncbi:phosphatase PAP2 family protein [Conexibacter sp. SYSU D00693]|uniref:phosphatase PAP2 family protein n=1 Tax=Conexibacter sp. SYSU D00693 TaxID=2812560 RepID=UPI00196A9016|nr:phosphatase PAP2 family protein [Conexibacter sp. SYSU D00693]
MARLPLAPEPAARRSLRARFAAGPVGRRVVAFDLVGFRLLRVTPRAEPAVRRFSACGEHAACWIAVGAVGAAVDRPRRERWLKALAIVALAYAINVVLKSVVRRKRPVIDGLPALIATPTKLSFPSSHAASSFAAARAYSALVPGAPLYATAAAMATSRVMLGVHYPSDVLCGAALGAGIGSLAR